MKRIIICLFACLSISLIFNSCSKEEESFDESLLIGTWKLVTPDGDEFYHFKNEGTGVFWYTGITETLGRPFDWTLDKADLTLIHKGDIVQAPDYFTVTSLTSTSLKYKDSFGDSYSLTKISK